MRLTEEGPEVTDEFTLAQFDMVYCDSQCPYCGSPLLAGPQGCGAQNVLCANLSCRQEFNLDAWGFTIDRNGKADDKRARMFGGVIRFNGGKRRVQPPSWLKRFLSWIGIAKTQ